MKTTKAMQSIITAIAAKHGVGMSASEAHLKLEQEGYMPLVIEKVGHSLVSVAHYYEQNGDLIPDPDVVFFIGYAEWVPIEITQVMGHQEVAWLQEDGKAIESLKVAAQKDLAQFCQFWAKNLRGQWLGRGTKAPLRGLE